MMKVNKPNFILYLALILCMSSCVTIIYKENTPKKYNHIAINNGKKYFRDFSKLYHGNKSKFDIMKIIKISNNIGMEKLFFIVGDSIYQKIALNEDNYYLKNREDTKMVKDIKNLTFKEVQKKYTANDCYDCYGVLIYSIAMKKGRLKEISYKNLTDGLDSGYSVFENE